MIKLITAIGCFLFAAINLNAQFSLTGQIMSEEDKILGASVSLYKIGEGTFNGAASNMEGYFKVNNLEAGKYNMIVEFLGYKKLREQIEIKTEDLNLGQINIEETAIEIEGIEIKGSIIQAVQKGDTTVFSADAFKTLEDADAKALIAKLPGITIVNGQIQSMGEDVKKVTVDGKEFFTNDPQTALNALPAEVIDKIEIIDEQSEQSRFTGFNDGNTTKTINIVTKVDKRNGQFGKLYAGFGENDRYQAGGNINIFGGDQRISIIGMSNNINQQNFTTDDILGVTGSSGRRRGGGRRGGGENFQVANNNGIAQTHAVGINFNDKWGEKVDFSGSYFTNVSDNEAIEIIDRSYFNELETADLFEENNRINSDNMNHRLAAKIDVKFDDESRLLYRPSFSWQSASSDELSTAQYINRNGTTETNNIYDSESSGFSIGNSLRYQKPLKKEGRTLSFNVGQKINPNDGDALQKIEQITNGELSLTDQFTKTDNVNKSYDGGVSLTEKIGKGLLTLGYRFSNEIDEADQLTYDSETVSGDILPLLSSDLETETNEHSAELGYMYRLEKTTFMLRSSLDFTNLKANQALPISNKLDQNYVNYLPMVMVRHKFNDRTNIRLFYRSSADIPSANQLSESINNSNPLQIQIGNIDLNQTKTHNLFTRFKSTNTKTNIVFFGYLGGSISTDYIGQKTFSNGRNVDLYNELNIDKNAQLSIYENLDNYYSMRSFLTLGLPVEKIKSKLNFNVSANYNSIPSIIDDSDNRTKDFRTGLGISLVSNISDKIDFTIGTTSNIGSTKNDLQPDLNTNYLNQSTEAKIDIVFPLGIVWRNNISHQYYTGYGDEFDGGVMIATMSLGKKIFPNDRGEISLSVFDLFDQNQSLSRNTTGNYIETSKTNVLGRYVMFNFKYDLRNFGQVPKESEEDKFRRKARERMFNK